MRPALVASLALALHAPAFAETRSPYADRPEVHAFIRDMAERHGFVERELAFMFSRIRRQDPILKSIQSQPEYRLPWTEYRATFVNDRRIQAGVEFWARHRKPLARARRQFGVPEEIVVAILGVETFYGRRSGSWRVVDALATLAFDYAPRADYFRAELEQYLLLVRQKGINVFSVQGSYAGAIGMPQFMPGSYLKYAIDFDGDGTVDLRANASDAIGSVANYLKQHGWRAGEAVQALATLNGADPRPYAGSEARFTLAELAQAGIALGDSEPYAHDGLHATIVELGAPDAPYAPSEYRFGFHNFHVLTTYNRSSFYASAVNDLARALQRARRIASGGAASGP